MKNIEVMMLAAGLMLSVSTQHAFAKERQSEKTTAKANNVKRSMKKGIHRTEEAICMKGDFSCGVDEAKNRTIEAKDATVDKTKETYKKIN